MSLLPLAITPFSLGGALGDLYDTIEDALDVADDTLDDLGDQVVEIVLDLIEQGQEDAPYPPGLDRALFWGDNGNDRVNGLVGEGYGPLTGAVLFGEGGNDTLLGSAKADLLIGGTGNDVIGGGFGGDVLLGNSGRDLVAGGPGTDLVFGGSGNDSLFGGAGRDTIFAGGGADTIVGDAQKDILHGEAGADIFEFRELSDSTPDRNRDVIFDFAPDEDQALLNNIAGFLHYIGDSPFSGTDPGEVRCNNGILAVDEDNDRVADFQVRLVGIDTLLPGDLILA